MADLKVLFMHVLAAVANQARPCVQLVSSDACAQSGCRRLLPLVPLRVALGGHRGAQYRLGLHTEHACLPCGGGRHCLPYLGRTPLGRMAWHGMASINDLRFSALILE